MAPPADSLEQFQLHLGYRFRDPALLLQALTHSSSRREPATPAGGDNERLEFLGDAALTLRAVERLVLAFPGSDEGELSRLRAWIVSARNLAAAAQRLHFGAQLRLGRAEERLGGRAKPRLLANAFEAVIGAIHLDGGHEAAAAFMDRCLLDASLADLRPGHLLAFGFKSALQEWAHAHNRPLPVYRVLETSGPAHRLAFTVEVAVAGEPPSSGAGASIKAAEQAAAEQALRRLGVLR